MDWRTLTQQAYVQDPWTILRIWLGIAFIMHGLPGVFDGDYMAGHTGMLEMYGIPLPEIMAYLSKGGELLSGLLLCFGLFTRLGALIVIVNMIVATFFAMQGDIFGDYQAEISFTYLLIAVCLFLNRPTEYSLDNVFLK